VVKTQEVEQDMKLGFVDLAKKVSLTWIAKAAKDESDNSEIEVESRINGLWTLGNLDRSLLVWTPPESTVESMDIPTY